MEIKPLPFDLAEVLHGPDTSPRAPGLHVSSVIRDLSNRILHKGQRQSDGDLSPEELKRLGTYRTLGFAWERVLERSMVDAFASGSCIRPGGIYLDGLHMTPDLIDLAGGALEEWKCTWRSSRRAQTPEDLYEQFKEWMWQIKSYLKGLGYTECRLRVFFVNGDYRDSGPQIKCWNLRFTQREIDDNWSMLKNHAATMVRDDAAKTKHK